MTATRATEELPGPPPSYRRALAAAVAVAIAGCVPASRYREPIAAPAGTDAPGVEATTAALVGDWRGEFDAPLYGRRGALQLSLRRVARGTPGSTVAGTATTSDGQRLGVDSARVGRGRVVLWLAPLVDQASGNTVWVRLDGALAADTLGGRLRGDAAATTAAERRGGWRVVRAPRPSPPAS